MRSTTLKAFSAQRHQTWRTPLDIKDALYAEFGLNFDPCPSDPTFDGLAVYRDGVVCGVRAAGRSAVRAGTHQLSRARIVGKLRVVGRDDFPWGRSPAPMSPPERVSGRPDAPENPRDNSVSEAANRPHQEACPSCKAPSYRVCARCDGPPGSCGHASNYVRRFDADAVVAERIAQLTDEQVRDIVKAAYAAWPDASGARAALQAVLSPPKEKA